MDHEGIRQAVAAYVLGSLDLEDREEVQSILIEHLSGCEECSTLMRDLREVSGDLALASAPLQVSEVAEQRLLAAVRDESRIGSFQGSSRSKRRIGVRLGAVAAAFALLVSGAYNVALGSRVHKAERRADALAPLFDVASKGTLHSVALRGSAGSVTLAYRPGGQAVLVAAGMPEPPKGRVFELWLIDGRAFPVATFVPRAGVVVLAVSTDPSTFRGVAITVERGFVPSPTTAPSYAGTLNA